MRRFVVVILGLFLTFPAWSQAPQPHPPPPAANQDQAKPHRANGYTNVNGKHIPSPVKTPSAPTGATAKCRDGSYSFSQHHQGTCSHHGGVATWLVN